MIGSISSSGTNRCSASAPPNRATCLISELEMCEYSPSAMRKTVSIVGVEPVVGQGHAELVLHVRERPQAAEDDPRPDPPHILDGQLLEPLHRDVGEGRTTCLASAIRSSMLNSDALMGLTPIPTTRCSNRQPAAPDHVEVAERDRVERARENGRAEWVGRTLGHGGPRSEALDVDLAQSCRRQATARQETLRSSSLL